MDTLPDNCFRLICNYVYTHSTDNALVIYVRQTQEARRTITHYLGYLEVALRASMGSGPTRGWQLCQHIAEEEFSRTHGYAFRPGCAQHIANIAHIPFMGDLHCFLMEFNTERPTRKALLDTTNDIRFLGTDWRLLDMWQDKVFRWQLGHYHAGLIARLSTGCLRNILNTQKGLWETMVTVIIGPPTAQVLRLHLNLPKLVPLMLPDLLRSITCPEMNAT